jgi:hypothetical protein
MYATAKMHMYAPLGTQPPAFDQTTTMNNVKALSLLPFFIRTATVDGLVQLRVLHVLTTHDRTKARQHGDTVVLC